MGDVMRSWRGAPIEELSASWGPPARTDKTGDITWYTWDESRTLELPSVITPMGTSFIQQPGGQMTSGCIRAVAADKSGVIVHAKWGGNACPSSPQDAKDWYRKQ